MYDVQHGQPPRQKTNNSLVEVAEPSFLSLIDFIDALFQCGFHAFQNMTCDTAIWDINDIVKGGRSWQPFDESKTATQIFVWRVFAIFATNASFLRVIVILQI